MQYSKVYYSYVIPCLFTDREVWIITANTANDNNKFQFHHLLSYIPKSVQLIFNVIESLRMAGSLLLAELLLLVTEGQAVTSESLGNYVYLNVMYMQKHH